MLNSPRVWRRSSTKVNTASNDVNKRPRGEDILPETGCPSPERLSSSEHCSPSGRGHRPSPVKPELPSSRKSSFPRPPVVLCPTTAQVQRQLRSSQIKKGTFFPLGLKSRLPTTEAAGVIYWWRTDARVQQPEAASIEQKIFISSFKKIYFT